MGNVVRKILRRCSCDFLVLGFFFGSRKKLMKRKNVFLSTVIPANQTKQRPIHEPACGKRVLFRIRGFSLENKDDSQHPPPSFVRIADFCEFSLPEEALQIRTNTLLLGSGSRISLCLVCGSNSRLIFWNYCLCFWLKAMPACEVAEDLSQAHWHPHPHPKLRFIFGCTPRASCNNTLLRRVLRRHLARASVETGVLRRTLRRGHRRHLEGALKAETRPFAYTTTPVFVRPIYASPLSLPKDLKILNVTQPNETCVGQCHHTSGICKRGRHQNADFRRKPQIFADSPLLQEIEAFGGRRKPQKTADFLRKPKIFAENRRKPLIGLRHLRCVTFIINSLLREI